MPIFIVEHGSVSGKLVGEPIELTQEEANHINSSGKMLRGEDEESEPRKRANSGVRIGLDNKPKKVELQGKVISTEADDSEPVEADEPEEVEAPVKPAKKPAAKKLKGG